MLITDGDAQDLSLHTPGDRLSPLLMSCFRGEIVPRKHHRYYEPWQAAPLCTQFCLNWQNPIDRHIFMHFIFFILTNNADNYRTK